MIMIILNPNLLYLGIKFSFLDNDYFESRSVVSLDKIQLFRRMVMIILNLYQVLYQILCNRFERSSDREPSSSQG